MNSPKQGDFFGFDSPLKIEEFLIFLQKIRFSILRVFVLMSIFVQVFIFPDSFAKRDG